MEILGFDSALYNPRWRLKKIAVRSISYSAFLTVDADSSSVQAKVNSLRIHLSDIKPILMSLVS